MSSVPPGTFFFWVIRVFKLHFPYLWHSPGGKATNWLLWLWFKMARCLCLLTTCIPKGIYHPRNFFIICKLDIFSPHIIDFTLPPLILIIKQFSEVRILFLICIVPTLGLFFGIPINIWADGKRVAIYSSPWKIWTGWYLICIAAPNHWPLGRQLWCFSPDGITRPVDCTFSALMYSIFVLDIVPPGAF